MPLRVRTQVGLLPGVLALLRPLHLLEVCMPMACGVRLLWMCVLLGLWMCVLWMCVLLGSRLLWMCVLCVMRLLLMCAPLLLLRALTLLRRPTGHFPLWPSWCAGRGEGGLEEEV